MKNKAAVPDVVAAAVIIAVDVVNAGVVVINVAFAVDFLVVVVVIVIISDTVVDVDVVVVVAAAVVAAANVVAAVCRCRRRRRRRLYLVGDGQECYSEVEKFFAWPVFEKFNDAIKCKSFNLEIEICCKL